MRIEAEIRKRSNLPVIAREFRDVAKLAVGGMGHEALGGKGNASYADCIRVIEEYLIPALGKRSITNIGYAALD